MSRCRDCGVRHAGCTGRCRPCKSAARAIVRGAQGDADATLRRQQDYVAADAASCRAVAAGLRAKLAMARDNGERRVLIYNLAWNERAADLIESYLGTISAA